jgi:predicted nucleotidyltransferase
MNADLQEAVALLTAPGSPELPLAPREAPAGRPSEEHWRWRLRLAQRIASELDGGVFGVKAFYVFGSTKNGTAGPGSDIDVIIHVGGTPEQRSRLEQWLDGWSLCLGEMNYLRTGYRTDRLLDVHYVTDQDIAERRSYASKIGAVTDAARQLPLMKDASATAG